MTGLIDIFKESLQYPIKDIKLLLIFGVFFVVMQLSNILFGWGVNLGSAVNAILGILALVAAILVFGYFVAVLRENISGSDAVPEIDFGTNFIDGIKYLIVAIVYMIIPFIISVIIAAVTGVFGNAIEIGSIISQNPELIENATALTQGIPQDLLAGLFGGLSITAVISVILFIIFVLLFLIASARLAETRSIKEALLINKVIEDIGEIGFGRYIGWYIIYIIIALVLGIIFAIISAIPYIGALLSALVCSPFIYLFNGRALGLLYGEK